MNAQLSSRAPSSPFTTSVNSKGLVPSSPRNPTPQVGAVKFVLTDRADYDFARAFIAEHNLNTLAGGILLSPAFSKSPSPLRTVDNATLDPRTLVEWMMADGIDARLSLQIHKFIWEPMKKGV